MVTATRTAPRAAARTRPDRGAAVPVAALEPGGMFQGHRVVAVRDWTAPACPRWRVVTLDDGTMLVRQIDEVVRSS